MILAHQVRRNTIIETGLSTFIMELADYIQQLDTLEGLVATNAHLYKIVLMQKKLIMESKIKTLKNNMGNMLLSDKQFALMEIVEIQDEIKELLEWV